MIRRTVLATVVATTVALNAAPAHAQLTRSSEGVTDLRAPILTEPSDGAGEDWTSVREASFTTTGDVTIAARRLNLAMIPLGTVVGDGGVYVASAQGVGRDALKHYAAVALINNLGWVTQVPVIGSQIASAAAAQVNPYLLAAAAVVILYDAFVTSNNTRERAFMVYAPVAGRYHFNVHFKGHWLTKPANTFTVFRSNGSVALNDTRVLSSDGDYDYFVQLPEGTSIFKVGLGSGSVNFHTAGQPNFVWLDDTVEQTFTSRGVPLISDRVSIASFAATPNADYAYTAQWAADATNLLDGRVVSVANVIAQAAKISPLVSAVSAGYIPCDEQLPPPIMTTQLDAVAAGTPLASGNTVTWSLRRNADKNIWVRYAAIRTLCP